MTTPPITGQFDNPAEQFRIHYMTITDYARMRGITRQGVHKAIKEKRLDAVRIGWTWYVRKEKK